MATIRNGNTAALLVIDVQTGVMANAWNRDGVIANINALVDQARSNDVPVIWIQHEADDLPLNSDEWQVVSELQPAEGETRIGKSYGDSFVETSLPQELERLGASHLIISGAQTSACVRLTTHRAMAEGYDVTLVSDAHTTDDIDWNGLSATGEDLVKVLNTEILFSEYPHQMITVADHRESIPSST